MEKYNLIEEKYNPLFKRKEIKFNLTSKATPSKTEVEKLISEKFSSSPEKIKIKKISSKFGINEFIVDTHIYTSKEDKDKTEIKTKKEFVAEKLTREAEKKAKQESAISKENISEIKLGGINQ